MDTWKDDYNVWQNSWFFIGYGFAMFGQLLAWDLAFKIVISSPLAWLCEGVWLLTFAAFIGWNWNYLKIWKVLAWVFLPPIVFWVILGGYAQTSLNAPIVLDTVKVMIQFSLATLPIWTTIFTLAMMLLWKFTDAETSFRKPLKVKPTPIAMQTEDAPFKLPTEW
jgi:hypothetical protein